MTVTRERAAAAADVTRAARSNDGSRLAGRLRRAVPLVLLPLALVACALAGSPWLRAFPGSVVDVPLFGAAVLSVLVPVVVISIGVQRLWLTAMIELALLVFFELLVVLRDRAGPAGLWDGLVHGPSELLSFALPLISPRSLLVAPIALLWVCGAVVGECIARGWQTVVPYVALLVTFGLSYAATARGIAGAGSGHHYDTLLGAALLLVLLLMRTTQSWVIQDAGAQSTQAGGTLPVRGLLIGTALAVLLAVGVAGVARTPAFHGPPTTPKIVPPLTQEKSLTPISFVSGLRPADPRTPRTRLFKITVDRASSNYVSVANLDSYDGDSWSFARTFAPSGGVIPADPVLTLRPSNAQVTQQFAISPGPLTSAPWMPYVQRPQKVSGLSVDVDVASGMITPTTRLHADEHYSVRSTSITSDLLTLKSPSIDGFGDSTIPSDVRGPLAQLVQTLAQETGVPSASGVPFLKAVAAELKSTSRLAGGPPTGSSAGPSSPQASARPSSPSSGASSSPAPSTAGPGRSNGGTSFADVLTSIRVNHTATPEQFATLMCLIARSIDIPARIGTGFRIGSSALAPGITYTVTTKDAWTWVEVPVSGAGWVVVDPSPAQYGGKGQQQTETGQPSPSATKALPTNRLGAPGSASDAVAPPARVPHHRHVDAVSALVVLLVVLGAVILLVIAGLLSRKAARSRRRRRTGDPRGRLLGAWQESLDVLQEAGLPDLTTATSREVSKATEDRFGDEPALQVRFIGDAANAAIFSSTSPIGQGEAEAAWRAHVVLRRSVRRRLTLRQRVGAQVRFHRAGTAAPVPSPVSWANAMRERAATGHSRARHSSAVRGRRTGR